MLSFLANPKLAIVAAVLLVGGGFVAYNAFAAEPDPLADAYSGIAVDLVVHTAIIDGGDGGLVASDASFELVATNGQAASFTGRTLSMGGIQPLDTCPSCWGSCSTLGLSTWVFNDAGGSNLRTPTSGILGRVTTSGGTPAVGATAALYTKMEPSGPRVYQGATTTDAAGDYRFAPFATANGMSAWVEVTYRNCVIPSGKLYAPATTPVVTEPAPTPTPGKVTIPVTLDGTVNAKNIKSDIKVRADVELTMPDGTKKTRSVTITLPPNGGPTIGLATSFKDLPLASVAGANTFRVVVTATATDLGGQPVSDQKGADFTKNVDANGRITIDVRPGSMTTIVGEVGTTRSVTYPLRARSFDVAG